MRSLLLILAGAGLAGLAGPAAAQAPMGPEAAHCRAGASGPAVLVNVQGFKSRRGVVRVQVHGSDGSTFLQDGKHLKRIEVPVPASGSMPICVRLPSAGRYALAVQHRTNHSGGWNPINGNDGGGFSRNPRLSPTKTRPHYNEVAFDVGNSVESIDVVLYYRFGLTVRPVR